MILELICHNQIALTKDLITKMGNGCISTEEKGSTVTCKFEIKTSRAVRSAGTDSSVYLEMIGDGGLRTGWIKLDNKLWDDFEKGTVSRFKRQVVDIGEPIAIRIDLKNRTRTDEWHCDNVTVHMAGTVTTFPINDWIEEDIFEVTKNVQLPHKIPDSECGKWLVSMRKRQVERNSRRFQWEPQQHPESPGWDLPRHANAATLSELPLALRGRKYWKRKKEALLVGKQIKSKIKTTFGDFQELSDYKQLNTFAEKPKFSKSWLDDLSFGDQILNGVCPLALERCSVVPEGCCLHNDDVIALMRQGKTLEEEVEAGRIYIVDCGKHLAGVDRIEGRNCCDAIALFYLNIENRLTPIAIQLVPGDREYLFTPNDGKDDWLLAKIHFKCAHANVHQFVYRYLRTIAVMEPFGLATFRCLPRSHPICRLLLPQLTDTVALATSTRESLLKVDGSLRKSLAISGGSLLVKYYKAFSLEDLNVPKSLEKQGLHDHLKLPGFYYRDDVVRLWKVMEDYVANIITRYYECDKDVVDDYELQGWAHDVAAEGFGLSEGNTKGMLDKIQSISELVEICLKVLFTCTVEYSATNRGMFDVYGFVPNAPCSMRRPPHKKGQVSGFEHHLELDDLDKAWARPKMANKQLIMESLPAVDECLGMINTARELSESAYGELQLQDGNANGDTLNLAIRDGFKEHLQLIKDSIRNRNNSLEMPYTCLLRVVE